MNKTLKTILLVAGSIMLIGLFVYASIKFDIDVLSLPKVGPIQPIGPIKPVPLTLY